MKFSTTLFFLGTLAIAQADEACITSCESTAASSLACDVSDLSGCFCLADFATAAKACLYQNSCSSDVSSFYDVYNSACASASESGAATTTTPSATAAASSSSASSDCIATCEQSAASSLGCDVSDLASCFCLADFATAAKNCLYQTTGCGGTYVSSFYDSYNSLCASANSTTALPTSTATVAATSGAVTTTASISSASGTTSSAAMATYTGGANVLEDRGRSLGVAIWAVVAAQFLL